jgi:hypothetical protein
MINFISSPLSEGNLHGYAYCAYLGASARSFRIALDQFFPPKTPELQGYWLKQNLIYSTTIATFQLFPLVLALLFDLDAAVSDLAFGSVGVLMVAISFVSAFFGGEIVEVAFAIVASFVKE